VSTLFSGVRTGEISDKRDPWLREQGLLNSLLLAFDSTFFHLNMIVRTGGEIICKPVFRGQGSVPDRSRLVGSRHNPIPRILEINPHGEAALTQLVSS
jgi:hypothetical protein